MPGVTRARSRVRGLDSALVVLTVFCGCAAVSYGRFRSFDASVMYAVARAIPHGRLHLVTTEPPFSTHFTSHNFLVQFPYSHYGIGESLVMLPLYVGARAVGARPDEAVTLANPLVVAVTAAVTRRLGLRLGWSAALATAVALALAFLTPLFQDSTEGFSEPGVTLGIALLLLGILRFRGSAPGGSGLLAGAGIAIAVLFRTDSLLLVAPFVLAAPALAAADQRWPRARAQLVGLVTPIVPALVWTAYYSHLSSGSFLPRSYGGAFTGGFWTGFLGQLLLPNKGFFFFAPWLLLAVPGLVLLWRRDRIWTLVLLGLFLVRVAFYAKWSYWYGGVAWGPRFAVPGVLPMALAAGEGLRAIPRIAAASRRAAAVAASAALVAWSGLVGVASVWVSYVTTYGLAVHVPPGLPPAVAAAVGRVGGNRHLHAVAYAQWWLAITHLAHTAPFGLYHFTGGPSPLGVLLVVLAVGGAGVLAARSRGGQPRSGAGRPRAPRGAIRGSTAPRSRSASTPRQTPDA